MLAQTQPRSAAAARAAAPSRQLAVVCKAQAPRPTVAWGSVASAGAAAAATLTILLAPPPCTAAKSACGYDPALDSGAAYAMASYLEPAVTIPKEDNPMAGSITMEHAPDLNGLGLPDSLAAVFMSVGGSVEVGPAEITPAVAEWVEVADYDTFEELSAVFPVAPGMSPGEALAEASGFPLDGFEHMDACALTQC